LIGVVEDRAEPRDLVPTDEEKVKPQESMFAYVASEGFAPPGEWIL
jgi:hypothetical protein